MLLNIICIDNALLCINMQMQIPEAHVLQDPELPDLLLMAGGAGRFLDRCLLSATSIDRFNCSTFIST